MPSKNPSKNFDGCDINTRKGKRVFIRKPVKTAQRIANAICELDNATFTSSMEVRVELEACRSKLFAIMRDLGYEFAKPDSRRIRKVLKIETAASILADMNRKQQRKNVFVNISPEQLRKKTLKAMSKRL